MNEYRVTKYNPSKRDEWGHYLDKDEWTDFCEVGKKVSIEAYEIVETAYINSAIEFLSDSGIETLQVVGLEDYQQNGLYKEGETIQVGSLEPVLRSLLRNEFWCRLESKLGFIHIGWDFYMYIGICKISKAVIHNAEKRGLFVEPFISPYHPTNC